MFFREQKLSLDQTLLHERALAAAGRFRVAQAELLAVIGKVECDRLYEKFGLRNTFQYCLEKLGLSEDVAASFLRVARVAEAVPALALAVEEGVSISKARKVASVITPENQGAWIEKVKTLTYEKLEREIAREVPDRAVVERVKPVAPERVRVELGLSQEMLGRLREAQERANANTFEETLGILLEAYLKEPKSRAAKPSKAVAAATRRAVLKRDQHSCQAKLPSGKTCGARRWVEVHHIQPQAAGGTHTAGNLITLCSSHHRQLHRVPLRGGGAPGPSWLRSPQAGSPIAGHPGPCSSHDGRTDIRRVPPPAASSRDKPSPAAASAQPLPYPARSST